MERVIRGVSGWGMVVVVTAWAAVNAWLTWAFIVAAIALDQDGGRAPATFWLLLAALVLAWGLWSVALRGFVVIEPNGSKVLLLFGAYAGTVKQAGLRWVNPLVTKRGVSLRVRTLMGERLKVNDLDGNPVDIAAAVIWRVHDTYRSTFEVDSYEQFVSVQTETALRQLASAYPYDRDDRDGEPVVSLRHNAGAMLRRQQAAAIIAARQRIVEGAVGMVEMALDRLERNQTVKLDEERRAVMISNLMVVLCSEHAAQPVVNAGTLYP